jgi:aryl-alcohol dehydrogenase-like predicted oxidoreductase
MTKPHSFSRRSFLKATGIATAASIVNPFHSRAAAPDQYRKMPTRPFGRTGVQVPILSFGGSLTLPLVMLGQAFRMGVTYWDTANSYLGGNSEKLIGKYLTKFPQNRRQLFLVTKSHTRTIDGINDEFEQSLKRLNTDYVDLFFVHSVSDIAELDGAKRAWADRKKKEGKIRHFGFSTHYNMETCMLGAAKLGWIDAIMMSYNFRLMHRNEMKQAVAACAEAGIGLTAMKTQGGGALKTGTRTEGEMVERLLQKGFSDAQAKLKMVWENPHIASICSEMPNMSILMANVAAALDRTQLSSGDRLVIDRYAHETRSDYCRGCTRICEAALDGKAPIGDIMRHLMYWHSYGDRHRAQMFFDQLSPERRMEIAAQDYETVERLCPQQMAIGRLVRMAFKEFCA